MLIGGGHGADGLPLPRRRLTAILMAPKSSCYNTRMDDALNRFGQLSDDQLVGEIKRLVGAERCATAELIRGLMEVDARRSYLHLGYSSLFRFCTQAMYLSEHAAYGRI